jgi:hypothetical protein
MCFIKASSHVGLTLFKLYFGLSTFVANFLLLVKLLIDQLLPAFL